MFITFEGPEGGGKSTQIRLLGDALRDRGFDVLVTREPGGTVIGNAIRAILLDLKHTEMNFRAEALLYFAARAQLVHQIIRPALDEGKIVLCDRYVDTSYAYQGYARGQSLRDMQMLAAFATDGLMPNYTIYLDIDPGEGLQRKQGEEWTRFEALELTFHERVREGYFQLINKEPARWLVVDARHPLARVHDEVLTGVLSYISTHQATRGG